MGRCTGDTRVWSGVGSRGEGRQLSNASLTSSSLELALLLPAVWEGDRPYSHYTFPHQRLPTSLTVQLQVNLVRNVINLEPTCSGALELTVLSLFS